MAITAATMPWHIDVNVFMTPISHVGFNSNSVNTSAIRNGYVLSGGTQNDEWNADVILSAGTWTFELLYLKNTDQGIFSVQLDGVEVGTVDSYNASLTFNNRTSITSITVAASGKKRLKLKMATKNASSSSYSGRLSHIQLRRTA